MAMIRVSYHLRSPSIYPTALRCQNWRLYVSYHALVFFIDGLHPGVLVGNILVGEFSPRPAVRESFDTDALARRLVQWERELPDELLRMPPDGTLGAPFWASVLHFSYQ